MAALFADLPEAIASTVEIAQRCAFRPRVQAPILPRFSVGEGGAAVDEAVELRARAEAGLERRIAVHGIAPGRAEDEYRARLAFELNVIEGMKYPGYFLIVSDFIQWAKGAGHPGRAGPRLRRRLARLLCADHHRSRSAALRSPVRALPQSRARVDARLRHRLLPGPARRSDPLCAGRATAATGWRRSSPSARCRRAACCATSAACCRCPMGRSTSSASWCRRIPPIRSSSAAPSTTSRACRPSATAIRWCGAPSTSRRSSKGCTATPRPTPPAS